MLSREAPLPGNATNDDIARGNIPINHPEMEFTPWKKRCRNICARIFRAKRLGVRLHPRLLRYWHIHLEM